MDNIYTLFKHDILNSADMSIPLLENIAGSNVFDSNELVEYLDKFKVKAPERLVQKITSFRQSTISLKLANHEFVEIILN